MIDEHNITNGMDMDSSDHTIPPGFYRRARNIIPRGLSGGKLRPESAFGARFVDNPIIDDVGGDKVIGTKYDAVNQRLFVFYNGNGDNDSILVYNTLTGIWQFLIVPGGGSYTHTDGNILNFSASPLITSIEIIYREDTDGDLLIYIDTLGRPTCINIRRYLNNPTPYPLVKRSFIDLIKAPPRMVPKCCYENDFTVAVNNLKNSLFQFRYRFVYDDDQKSVYSSGSEVPLPNARFGFENADITDNYNARIAVYVSTGDADVKKIEIWAKQTNDIGKGTSGADTPIADFFLVKSLDKADLSIPSNDIYRYLFYNDGVYTPGDIEEQDQLQDYVPKKSNCLELLNGNIPVLGGNTEGFDKQLVNMSVSSLNETNFTRCTFNGALFFASQDGVADYGTAGDDIKIYLTGAGSNNAITGTPDVFYATIPQTTQIVFTGDEQFIVNIGDGFGGSLSFQYVLPILTPPTYLIVDILNGLATAANGAGFTAVVDPINNILTVNHIGAVLFGAQVYTQTLVTSGQYQGANLNTHFAFPHQSAEDFAIQYFDQSGRTNGALIALNSQITTPTDVTGTSLPLIQLFIQSRPPLWAYYYHLVRAQNLTYAKALFWVCNQVFNNVDLDTGINYAYIGITNMPLYNKNIEASTPVVSYEFSPGDRVRFEIRYPGSTGSFPQNLPPFDYEIISVAQNPLLNGVAQKGTFLKIVYPPDANSFSFGFPNPPGFPGITSVNYFNFQNYKIFIYSYEKHATNKGSELFYEFGKQFAIGNPGTVNAYHIAPEQSQPPDLSVPAIIRVDDGNFFFRYRNVPAGATYYVPAGNNAFSNPYATLTVTPENGDVIIPSQYTIGHQNGFAAGLGITNYPGPTDVNALFWNQSGSDVTIRVHGDVDVHTSADTFTSIKLKIVTATNVVIVPLVARFALPLPETIQSYNIPFDGYASIPAGAKCWILGQNGNGNGLGNITLHWGVFTIQIDISLNITIPIIEESYSDKYQIVTNSNSRSTVFDENAKEQYLSTQIRWALPAILNTSVNNINRFYFSNSDEIDRSFGDLMRMRVRGRELRFFQKRRCGHTGIYARFLKQNDGQDVVATTNEIISKNNVEYFEGEFGLGNQPASLCSSGYADYFIDPVKGYALRLSLDGLITISDKYRVQSYIGTETPKYLNDYFYPWGGTSAILGVYNFTKDRESEALFVLQSGGRTLPDDSNVFTIGETIAFNEAGNRWTSLYDFAPDQAVCCENTLYSFFNARMYIHDSINPYCNYYGTQYVPSITLVKNENAQIKKSWISISEISNVKWLASLIYTETETYPGQRQESTLTAGSFKLLEGQWHASFMRDLHSLGGKAYGDKLKGTFLVIQLEPEDGAKFAYLAGAPVKYIISAVLVK